jgi:hypothetical protein
MIDRRTFSKTALIALLTPLSNPSELCPVCKTAQLTYEVKGQEGRCVYIVKHDYDGHVCTGSHSKICAKSVREVYGND